VQRAVRTPDGRLLAVEDRGDPAGWPVLVHHGNPSSRHSAFKDPYVRDAAERGLRLISYDRPGFGQSSPQPGRTVAGTAVDVRAICAELGIDRMVTWGGRGDSTRPTSLSRSCCCTAGRTSSSRPATANGWPRTFPAPRPGGSTMTGTTRSQITYPRRMPGYQNTGSQDHR
jgi:alpha/beta hydrolase fold